MGDELSKAIKRRFNIGTFHTRYFVGQGIDIGHVSGTLSHFANFFARLESVRDWSKDDGDPQLLTDVPDNSFDFLNSSNCLEHLNNLSVTLKNWIRVVKPGGYLILTVPDEDLYEQGIWPSRFNPDHKCTFTIQKETNNMWSAQSINVLELLARHTQWVSIEKIELIREFFDDRLVGVDQTMNAVTESCIEIILRKLPHAPLMSPESTAISTVNFKTPRWGGLGDTLCFVAAARIYAQRHPNTKVVINEGKDIVEAYGDDLVQFDPLDDHPVFNPNFGNRTKTSSPAKNYVGCFLTSMGEPVFDPPALELPKLRPIDGLTPRAYVALQPYSGFAANPHERIAFVQAMVNVVRDRLPGYPIACVGHPNTPRDLDGVDYGHLSNNVLTLLSVVQHACLILTPRSASAHAAAGYRVPSYIWVPNDGENWHLDYPFWDTVRIPFDEGLDVARQKLIDFIEALREIRKI
jgi:SAM-dependent methyltransferase